MSITNTRNHGCGIGSLRLHLQDGVRWGFRFGDFLFQDEDPLARQ